VKTIASLVATWLLSQMVWAASDPYQPSYVPEAVFATVVQAREVRLSGNPGLAVSELEGVVRTYPEYFLGRYNLGLTYAALRRTDAAIAELVEAKRLNTRFELGEPTIYVSLAALHTEVQQYDKALAELRVATRPPVLKALDPNSRKVAFNNLGYAYSRLKRSCEADLAYELAKAIPDNASETPVPQSSGVVGHWAVQEWIQIGEAKTSSNRSPWVTGALIIRDRHPDGSFPGDLTLCVRPTPSGSREPLSRLSPFDVRQRMKITLKDGAEVLMVGQVTTGSLSWSDDRITGKLLGDTIAGIAHARVRGVSSAKDLVRFVRVW
jgi:hypothetical protein